MECKFQIKCSFIFFNIHFSIQMHIRIRLKRQLTLVIQTSNIGPNTPSKRLLSRPNIRSQSRLGILLGPLHESSDCIEIPSGQIQRSIGQNPGHGLPTARLGQGSGIRDVMVCRWHQVTEAQMGTGNVLTSIKDLKRERGKKKKLKFETFRK